MTISSFSGEYRFLSNFYPAYVELDGDTYATVEHAYQAAKTPAANLRSYVRCQLSPGLSKKAGRTLPLREDWPQIKLSIMEGLLVQKFKPGSNLAFRLDRTLEENLIEGNTWGDTYWGVCQREGENNLGKLLMKIRLKNRETPK